MHVICRRSPVGAWLYAKCREYVDPDATAAEQEAQVRQLEAEVQVRDEYDGLVAAPPHEDMASRLTRLL